MTALRGMYGGAGKAGLSRRAALDKWVGAPTDAVSDAITWLQGWSGAVNAADATAADWAAFRGFKCVGIPLCMTADAGGYDLAGAAAGTYTAKYRSVLTAIKSRNVGNIVLRPGWEMNGGWYPWGVNAPRASDGKMVADATRAPLFVQAYRQFAAAAREILPGVLLCWNPAWGNMGVPTQSFYPGDDVVDFVGMDVYNVVDPAQPTWPDSQRWTWLKTSTNGLDWLATFAAQHKRKIIIPEWGTGYKRNTAGVDCSKDSGAFITSMAAWIASHDVFMANYFHYPAGDGQWQLGADVPLWSVMPGSITTANPAGTPAKQFPLASAAYKAAYGVTPMALQIDTDYTALGNAIAAAEAAKAAVQTATTNLAAAQADADAKKAAMQAAYNALGADVSAF